MSSRPFHLIAALTMVASGLLPLAGQAGKPKTSAPVVEEQLAWPAPPAPARIKWVAEYRNAFDVGAKKKRSFLDRLAGKSEEVIWLQRPLSVAVDENGVIFVGDYVLGVVVMDPANKSMTTFSQANGTVLASPTGLAVDSKFVWVANANGSELVQFDKSGRQLGSLGTNSGINRPVGVAVDEARDMVVLVNGGEHAVRIYNRSLKLLKTIGSRGVEEGLFNFPTHVCMVPGVGFAVADTGNFRIQIFDYNGRFLRVFGSVGDAPGQFQSAKGMAVDPDGHLYVGDAAFNNFQVFNLDGQPLTFVGVAGTRRGQFQVPSGIAITADGSIYVADQMNRRIQKFQYLSEGKDAQAPPPTLK